MGHGGHARKWTASVAVAPAASAGLFRTIPYTITPGICNASAIGSGAKVIPRKPRETNPCFRISSTLRFTVST